MSDRLAELRRQRDLVEEHLAWLKGEIAAAENDLPHPPTTLPPFRIASFPTEGAVPSPVVPAGPSAPIMATPAVDAPAADEILEQYRTPPSNLHQNVKKGCLLYFAAAFVLLCLGVTVLYFLISSQ